MGASMRARRQLLFGLIASWSLTVASVATAVPTPKAAKGRATAKKPAGPDPAANLAPVSLKLSLSENGPDEKWQLKIENNSSITVNVADELRLLWLEVSLPGQTKPKLCTLPAELLPKSPSDKTTEELDPGESLVHRLDPRFYCFSPDKQEILVPTAQVTPHYGWPSKTKRVWHKGHMEEQKLPDLPPFVAEADDPKAAAPAKNLSGDSVVLDSRYASWAMDTANPNEDEGDEPVLEMVRGSDAKSELSVVATVRVRNPGRSRLTVFVRRELVTFEVLTPRGTVQCASEPDKRNPERRAFVTLAPHGSTTVVSRLVELCPRGTFAESGLYLVHARFDAAADGADYGIDAFTGSLRTARPVPVRVRHSIHIIPNRTTAPGGAIAAIPGQPQMMMPPPPMPVMPPPPPPPPPPQ
jgi:hypothetical protein